ncbi:MAG: hypothetical protein IPM29_10640 [Planctomycetes bacterium]|nr:hypothetical protein [Planctomycetota bacterium]
MRVLRSLLPLLLCACEAMAPDEQEIPDWSGPPVHATWQPDGSIAVALTAPTASHTLDVVGVDVVGDTAAVHLDHQRPGSAFVAQVVTEVTATVPKERLQQATAARILISTRERGAAPGPPQLSVVLHRQ